MDKSKKYKQRSTKHTYKTKDRVTRTHSEVLVTLSLVLYVCFVDRSLYFLLLSIVLSVFSGVLVTLSLVLYVCFVDRCLYKTKDRVTRTPLKTYNTMDKSKKYKERSTKHTYKTSKTK
jgi:hypothetical protein